MGKQSKLKRERQQLKSHKPTDFLYSQRNIYLAEWRDSAAYHSELGHYQWMAGLLGRFDCGFDIGIGDGSGLLELAKYGRVIVSVDENSTQTERAKERLIASGLETLYIQREIINDLANNSLYHIQYGDIPLHASLSSLTGICLIDGDCNPLADEFLSKWLHAIGTFDVMTCWLMGTHRARQRSYTYHQFDPNRPDIYRQYIHTQTYDLANELLKPGGLLQVVDRGPGSIESIKDSSYRDWQEKARTTSLILKSIDAIEYKAPESGIRLIGPNGQNVPEKLALYSIISQKAG